MRSGEGKGRARRPHILHMGSVSRLLPGSDDSELTSPYSTGQHRVRLKAHQSLDEVLNEPSFLCKDDST